MVWLFADMVRDYGETFYSDYRKKMFENYLEKTDKQIEAFHKKLLVKVLSGIYGDSVIVTWNKNTREEMYLTYDPVIRNITLLVKKDKSYSFVFARNNIEALKVLIAKVYSGDVELVNLIPGKCDRDLRMKKSKFELIEMQLQFEVKEKPTPIDMPLTYDVGSKS